MSAGPAPCTPPAVPELAAVVIAGECDPAVEAEEATAAVPELELDERDLEPRTPMKRLGSTRKLAAFNNIRAQLSEHQRLVEARGEAACGVAGELADYCRRRADLEHEYSRALLKLHHRHRDHKHKREQWEVVGAFACWQEALEQTRLLARDHAALAELYGGVLAARLVRAADHALRLHRKCKEIVSERHEEVGAALGEAASAGKTAATAAADWRLAANKLRRAREALAAATASTGATGGDDNKNKKLKSLDKELEKRRARHGAARGRALRARADYVLSLEAANATLQRYFLDDIADIILCAEVGFSAVVERVMTAAGGAEQARGAALCGAGAALCGAGAALDALADRDRVLRAAPAAFTPPAPLAPAAGHDADMAEADAADDETAACSRELAARLAQLETAARTLRSQCRASARALHAAEAELLQHVRGADAGWDVSAMFQRPLPAPVPPAPPALDPATELLPDGTRRDPEDYYLSKFRAYVSCAGRLSRLEGKASAARARLGLAGGTGAGGGGGEGTGAGGRFAPALDACASGGALPAALTECVRVVSQYGARHQGVFRVSGSQLDTLALRAAFERGEQPLAGVRDAADINSICGLLKLWLREVRPPLLPPQLQPRLLAVAALSAPRDFVPAMAALVRDLAPGALLVLRYLFAFLAHLASYARYNMMDEWNLAVCLGPTLLAAGGDSQVAAQNQLNELVKRTILHHLDVFPQDVAPHTLYTPPPEVLDGSPGEDTARGAGGGGGGRDEPDTHDDAASLYDDDTDESSDEAGEAGDVGEVGEVSSASESEERDSLRSVGSQPGAARPPAPPARRFDTTPDLVLDLPARASAVVATPTAAPAPGPAPGAAAAGEEPGAACDGGDAVPDGEGEVEPADAADTFLHNRDTLKKRSHHKQSSSVGGGAGESARAVSLVAARFASLTLTGGSLKPALAAKPSLLIAASPSTAPCPCPAPPPALLRRPTPHPQHAHTRHDAHAHAHTHAHTDSTQQ